MKLALIGCGLLGGSLAAAWRSAGAIDTVIAHDANPSVRESGAIAGIDHWTDQPEAAIEQADVVVLAVPVRAMEALLPRVAAALPEHALITDVGSTKANLVEAARVALSASQWRRFVPAHPIAGGALPGAAHARATLFDQRWVITTPAPDTDAAAVATIEAIWSACGARVQRMAPEEHDRIFAAVSHLPHVLAFALVHQIAQQPDGHRTLQFAGAGFRDFTRIAASDPAMWRDIALANREALLAQIDAFGATLARMRAAVALGDGAALDDMFSLASRVRREHGPVT